MLFTCCSVIPFFFFYIYYIRRQRQTAWNVIDINPNREDLIRTNVSSKDIKKMGYCRWRWDWFVNGLIVLSLCGLIIILELEIIPFRPIGFHCGDPKISHKFQGDTISFGYLLGITFFVPLIGICLVEALAINPTPVYKTAEKKRNLTGVKQGWHWYCQFVFGLLIVIFITEAGKSLIAEPRPHFLDTCRPDKAVNCTSGYISDFKCTNKNLSKLLVRDSFRSFPSGHSALGIYMAVFMIWFFQKRIPQSSYLIVPWLQCLFLFWGMLCALTRITDHRHHWWDVLAGALCGVGMAIYTVKTCCKSFFLHRTKTPKLEKTESDTSNDSRHTSSRRLLSSTSSYGTPPDDRELREVQMP